MMIPLSIALAAILICSGLALASGLCLGASCAPPQPDLRAEIVAYAALVAATDHEQVRRVAWTPDLRERFRRQEERARAIRNFQARTRRRVA